MKSAGSGVSGMCLFTYEPNANDFAGIGLSRADHTRVVDMHFTDKPLADSWIAPVVHGFEDNPAAEGDFPSLSNYNQIPVMSKMAWDAVRPLIGYCCEALPIVHPAGEQLYIIHVMDTIDCLDRHKSEFTTNRTTGRINRIYKYCFRRSLLSGRHILKLPIDCGGELFVDDEFRRLVEMNSLKGLTFTKLETVE